MSKNWKSARSRARKAKLYAQVAALSADERTEDIMKLPPADAPLDLLGRPKPQHDAVPSAAVNNTGRRVTVMEDTDLKMPELWLSVFVFGPEAGPAFNKMFARSKCLKAETPDDADLVVFTGSAHDIDPQLYGENRHKSSYLDHKRDKENMTLYGFCHSKGIPMFGVCGGAQFLHVMQGGKLFQDVDGHNEPHTMFDNMEKVFIERISSVHHQMCVPNIEGGMEVIGSSSVSTERWYDDKMSEIGKKRDVEGFWYRATACLGVQGHPEYAGFPKYTQWALKAIDHYCNENPDLSYQPNDSGRNKLRIKPELLAERTASKAITVIEPPSAEMIIVEQR